jgi:histidinol phosphatase-like enzyme (inositol monophosphatase family)
MAYDEFKSFFGELARASGEIIAPLYRDAGLAVHHKSDGSPVTEADRRAEAVMREMISARYPSHGIMGEEMGTERADAEFVWVLDPIDGTISFTAGCPLFATLVGLLHHGRPVVGMIHQPITQQLCLGDGDVTLLDGEPVRVRPVDALSDAVLLTTDVENIGRYQNAAGFERLRRQCKLVRTWGDAYGYLLLATGRADVMLDAIMNPWDVLPLVPVVAGAGGIITDWHGNDASSGNSAVAAAPAIHARVIELLNGP